jgi:hypothetical protein
MKEAWDRFAHYERTAVDELIGELKSDARFLAKTEYVLSPSVKVVQESVRTFRLIYGQKMTYNISRALMILELENLRAILTFNFTEAEISAEAEINNEHVYCAAVAAWPKDVPMSERFLINLLRNIWTSRCLVFIINMAPECVVPHAFSVLRAAIKDDNVAVCAALCGCKAIWSVLDTDAVVAAALKAGYASTIKIVLQHLPQSPAIARLLAAIDAAYALIGKEAKFCLTVCG